MATAGVNVLFANLCCACKVTLFSLKYIKLYSLYLCITPKKATFALITNKKEMYGSTHRAIQHICFKGKSYIKIVKLKLN